MAKVDILIIGNDEGEVTDSFQKYAATTTLVRTEGANIIVDPGTHKSREEYALKLKEFSLSPEDINYVFITHEHLDHTRDIALFPYATVIDRWGFHTEDEHNLIEDESLELFPDVIRIATPGHTSSHSSLLVDTDLGKICLAGDVWWFEDFTPEVDPFAVNQKELEKTRKHVLKTVDYVIPGHGGLVKVRE